MKQYFWILKLRVPTFLRIILTNNSKDIVGITYIDASWPASLMLKIIMGLKLFRTPIVKIKNSKRIAGPILNLAEVRNDRGEVFSMDIYHHILSIRRKICCKVMDSFQDLSLLKKKKSQDMLAANLGILIAQEIQTAVYFANYARWKSYNFQKTNQIPQSTKDILVLPKSQWSQELKEEFSELIDEVQVEKRREKPFNVYLEYFKYYIKVFWWSFFKTAQIKKPCVGDEKKDWKIMVNYSIGVDQNHRNDIAFFYASSLSLSRLLLHFKSKAISLGDEELKWMKENCVTNVSAPNLTPGDGVPNWQSTDYFKRERINLAKAHQRILKKQQGKSGKYFFWLLMKLWEIDLNTAYWKDFFIANQVKIVVFSVPSKDNFIPSLAISEIDGLVVTIERSILFDYCTFIHNPPNHIFFVTGPYSLTQIPEPSFSQYTIQVGGINIDKQSQPIVGIEELKSHSKFIITIFDEMPNDVFFGNSVKEMYEAMMDLMALNVHIGFLIKTKKPQVFESIGDVYQGILKRQKEKRCILADWKVTTAAAAAVSDLVVGVPSTAVFESVMSGTRTIVYNPMRSGSRIFYRNGGGNRRIFEDPQKMIEAILNLCNGSAPNVGDCSDIAAKIDPFLDKGGPKRVGEYLNWCLQAFDSGKNNIEVIKQANDLYIKEYGQEKVTVRDLCETKN